MIYYQSQNCGKSNQQFDSEVILLTTDGSLVSDQDQVDVSEAAEDEEDLDWGVVPGDEIEEYIVVSCNEDQEI